MRERQNYGEHEKPAQAGGSGSQASVPVLVSARTGLAGKDDALVRRVPQDYSGRTVQEVIEYLVGDAKSNETSIAESVRKEMRAEGRVVVINGKTAKLDDKVEKYMAEKTHTLPSGEVKKYRELEIEISAVQQGGLYNLLE